MLLHPMILVVQAHPYPDRSRANRILARAIDDLPGRRALALRPLSGLRDRRGSRAARARRAPTSSSGSTRSTGTRAPALQKLWFEKVLTPGWAYGPGGDALRGKGCLWVVTTGGDETDYRPAGHPRPSCSTPSRRSCDRPPASAAWTGSSRSSCTPRRASTTRRCYAWGTALPRAADRARRERGGRPMHEHSLLTDAVDLPRRGGRLRAAREPARAGLGARLPLRRLRHRPVRARARPGRRSDPPLRRVRRRAHAVRDRPRARAGASVGDARRTSSAAGALQMAVCGAALWRWPRAALGLPWPAAVVAGLALALSSTAIAVQTMTERGLLGSPLGRAAFGILLFQDIAAIPLIGGRPAARGAAGAASRLAVGRRRHGRGGDRRRGRRSAGMRPARRSARSRARVSARCSRRSRCSSSSASRS